MNEARISMRVPGTHALVDAFMDELVECFVDAVNDGVVEADVVEPLLNRIGVTILNSFFVTEVRANG